MKLVVAYYRTDDAYGDSLTAVYATVGPERTLTPNGEPLEQGIRGYTAAMYNVAQNTVTYGVLSADFLRRFCRPIEERTAREFAPGLPGIVKHDAERIFKAS